VIDMMFHRAVARPCQQRARNRYIETRRRRSLGIEWRWHRKNARWKLGLDCP